MRQYQEIRKYYTREQSIKMSFVNLLTRARVGLIKFIAGNKQTVVIGAHIEGTLHCNCPALICDSIFRGQRQVMHHDYLLPLLPHAPQ